MEDDIGGIQSCQYSVAQCQGGTAEDRYWRRCRGCSPVPQPAIAIGVANGQQLAIRSKMRIRRRARSDFRQTRNLNVIPHASDAHHAVSLANRISFEGGVQGNRELGFGQLFSRNLLDVWQNHAADGFIA